MRKQKTEGEKYIFTKKWKFARYNINVYDTFVEDDAYIVPKSINASAPAKHKRAISL